MKSFAVLQNSDYKAVKSAVPVTFCFGNLVTLTSGVFSSPVGNSSIWFSNLYYSKVTLRHYHSGNDKQETEFWETKSLDYFLMSF